VLQGAPAILLDNLQRHVASSTLESMLTEEVADIRTFGRLSSIRVACRALVLLTANNASLRRDMLRRSLPVRIVVPDEKPELRSFDFDPVDEARRDRQELLTAAFTLILAWLKARELAENKCHRKPLGSFEEWADLVAGAVSWLTGKSPVDLIEEQKDQDQNSGDARYLIETLAEWQAKLLDEQGWPRSTWSAKEAASSIDVDLWRAVLPSFKEDRPTARKVGDWLKRRKDTVFGDKMLTGQTDRNGVMEWSVRGHAGPNPTPHAKSGRDGDNAKSYSGTGDRPSGTPQTPQDEFLDLVDEPL
jgi:hypothetical protein